MPYNAILSVGIVTNNIFLSCRLHHTHTEQFDEEYTKGGWKKAMTYLRKNVRWLPLIVLTIISKLRYYYHKTRNFGGTLRNSPQIVSFSLYELYCLVNFDRQQYKQL